MAAFRARREEANRADPPAVQGAGNTRNAENPARFSGSRVGFRDFRDIRRQTLLEAAAKRSEEAEAVRHRAAYLLAFAEEAYAALSAPDPDLEHERAEIAAARATEVLEHKR